MKLYHTMLNAAAAPTAFGNIKATLASVTMDQGLMFFPACNNLTSGRIMKTYEAGNTGVCQTGRIKIPAFNIRTSQEPALGDLLKNQALEPKMPGEALKLNIRTTGRIITVRPRDETAVNNPP